MGVGVAVAVAVAVAVKVGTSVAVSVSPAAVGVAGVVARRVGVGRALLPHPARENAARTRTAASTLALRIVAPASGWLIRGALYTRVASAHSG